MKVSSHFSTLQIGNFKGAGVKYGQRYKIMRFMCLIPQKSPFIPFIRLAYLSLALFLNSQATNDKRNMLSLLQAMRSKWKLHGKYCCTLSSWLNGIFPLSRTRSLLHPLQSIWICVTLGGMYFTAVNRMKLKADTLKHKLRTFFSSAHKCVKQIPVCHHINGCGRWQPIGGWIAHTIFTQVILHLLTVVNSKLKPKWYWNILP